MSRGRPRRFPNGTKTVMLCLPPEVIEAFEAKGGREWLFTELGFDFGPKPNTNTAKAKQTKESTGRGWSILQSSMFGK